MDSRRARLVHEAAELKAQVVEVAGRNRVFLELLDDRLEVRYLVDRNSITDDGLEVGKRMDLG